MICQIFSRGTQAGVANSAGIQVEGPRHLSIHTHAPCTASKTQPSLWGTILPEQPMPTVAMPTTRLSPDPIANLHNPDFVAQGNGWGKVRYWCKFNSCRELGSVHQPLASVDAKGSTGNPQMGFTFHWRVILPGDWACDLYHSEFYLQIGKWQCVL